jgi:hypothetical protein
MRRRTLAWLGAGIVLLAAAGVLSVTRLMQHPTAIAILRDSLGVLRAAADSCTVQLVEQQAGLLDYSARLDSVRGRVRELESRDPRGVPVDSYQVYMGLFDAYNDSAAGWSDRVDTLHAVRDRCRDVTEAHNAVADSLRRLLADRARRSGR